VLGQLADWADTLEADRLVRLGTYRGKNGMTTLLPRLAGDDAGMVSIYCDNGSAYLQFWRSVFERRAPRSIAAVEAVAQTEIRQGNTTRDITGPLLEANPEMQAPPSVDGAPIGSSERIGHQP
jgi:hypothetical protein